MPKQREAKPLLKENQTHKRRERAQELRSSRRQGVLAKRRKLDPATQQAGGGQEAGGGSSSHEWSKERLAAAVQGVQQRGKSAAALAKLLPHLTDLRKLLSLEDNPVEEVVEKAGLAPRLIELLGASNDEIQIEATWYVANNKGSPVIFNICLFWLHHRGKYEGWERTFFVVVCCYRCCNRKLHVIPCAVIRTQTVQQLMSSRLKYRLFRVVRSTIQTVFRLNRITVQHSTDNTVIVQL